MSKIYRGVAVVCLALVVSGVLALIDNRVGADAPQIEPLGQFGGASYAIAVQGQVVYAGVGLRLVALDVSDPTRLVALGQTGCFPGMVRGAALSGGYAYVAASEGGLRVVDITNPSAPAEVGRCATPASAWNVAVSGDYAYVAARGAGVRVINIADPAAPHEVGAYTAPSDAYDVAALGDNIYVAGYGNLYIANVSYPSEPQETAVINPSPTNQRVYSLAILADGIATYAYTGTDYGL